MEGVHHDVQVVSPHGVHQGNGLLQVAHSGPGKELHIIVQAILLGHCRNFSNLLCVIGPVPGPNAAQYIGAPQLSRLFKRGLILADVQIGTNPGQLDIHQGHIVLLQRLLGGLKELGVLVEQKLRLPRQMHGDGTQTDKVISGFLRDPNLIHGGRPGYCQVGERKLAIHTVSYSFR